MKKTFSLILGLGLIGLSGFMKMSMSYEQITFDYFVSDILKRDFKDITAFKFKGETEETYSPLGQIQVLFGSRRKPWVNN